MPPPNPAHAALAGRLVQARQAAGFTTPEAAAISLALNPQTYVMHEQGRSGVKAAELCRYFEAFGVPHGWPSTSTGQEPRTAAQGWANNL